MTPRVELGLMLFVVAVVVICFIVQELRR